MPFNKISATRQLDQGDKIFHTLPVFKISAFKVRYNLISICGWSTQILNITDKSSSRLREKIRRDYPATRLGKSSFCGKMDKTASGAVRCPVKTWFHGHWWHRRLACAGAAVGITTKHEKVAGDNADPTF